MWLMGTRNRPTTANRHQVPHTDNPIETLSPVLSGLFIKALE